LIFGFPVKSSIRECPIYGIDGERHFKKRTIFPILKLFDFCDTKGLLNVFGENCKPNKDILSAAKKIQLKKEVPIKMDANQLKPNNYE